MDKIVDLCKEYDVILLEDFCESLGSEFQNKKLGTFGSMGCSSSYFGHHCSTIEGGLITTNDKELYEIAVAMRSHGWDRDLSNETKTKLRTEWNVNDFDALYTFYYPGFNLRSTDLQAFIGLTQLEKLKDFVNKRSINYNTYFNQLNNISKLENVLSNDGNIISNFAYPIISKSKIDIVNKLINNNIEVRPLIAGNMANKPFWKSRYEVPSLPNCELVDKYGFYIPNNQDITEEEINFVCHTILN